MTFAHARKALAEIGRIPFADFDVSAFAGKTTVSGEKTRYAGGLDPFRLKSGEASLSKRCRLRYNSDVLPDRLRSSGDIFSQS
jgi:hypothetical protein